MGVSSHNCPDECPMCTALDAMRIGFILMDPVGRVRWINRAAAGQLNLNRGECMGRPLAKLLKDPQFAAFWHSAGRMEDAALGEVSVKWPAPAELKVNATFCIDDAGNQTGRALLFCDVTHEKTVQVQLSHDVTKRLLEQSGIAEEETAEPAAALSPPELRVLTLVGKGNKNDQIAEELGVAISTVRSHLKRVYSKLGLDGRAEAISYAIRHGLT